MKKYPEHNIKVPCFNEANGFYTTKGRSELMAKIKGVNTKPELKLRKALWGMGFRYRKNVKKLPGAPDLVFYKFKLAIFVDGEFWHGYNWEEKRGKIKSNRDFWIPKIERNMQRDRQNRSKLENEGWVVLRFWEREIYKDFDNCIIKICSYLQ